jgi:hypothetical protein
MHKKNRDSSMANPINHLTGMSWNNTAIPLLLQPEIKSIQLLILAVSLCISFTGCCTIYTRGECGKCVKNSWHIERDGSFSAEDKTMSITATSRKRYQYMPFTDWAFLSKPQKESATYSLTSPPDDAELFQWEVIPTNNTTWQFDKRSWDIPQLPVEDSNAFILPVLHPKQNQNDSPQKYQLHTQNSSVTTVFIHSDEIDYFSKPFLLLSPKNRFKLLIPYKIEDNLYYLYSPKDSGILFNDTGKLNFAGAFWTVLLIPPACVLDIVLSPFEILGATLFITGMNW